MDDMDLLVLRAEHMRATGSHETGLLDLVRCNQASVVSASLRKLISHGYLHDDDISDGAPTDKGVAVLKEHGMID